MIKSMTGYGNAEGSCNKIDISIELRSVNNRYFDCNIRIPRVYTAFEDEMKAIIQRYVSRGRIDVYVTIDSSQTDNVTIKLNETLLSAYLKAFNDVAEKYKLENDATVMAVSRLPDVLTVEKQETDKDVLCSAVCEVLEKALVKYNEMRTVEGARLKDDLSSKADKIEALVKKVEERSPKTVAEYREKLYNHMSEVLANTEIDEGRLLMEAAIFADKVAVEEETVRLHSHLAQLRTMINLDEPIGRKLDFLVQELNREANTIGSKGNDIEIAKIVMEIKAEIEKIREQAQNIE